jgi:hypothetical protein
MLASLLAMVSLERRMVLRMVPRELREGWRMLGKGRTASTGEEARED